MRSISFAMLVVLALGWSARADATDKPEAKAKPAAAAAKVAATPASATPAKPTKGSFEYLLKTAVPVYNLKSLLRPFVATCAFKKTRFKKLFCSALNERLKAQHQTKVYHLPIETTAVEGPLVAFFKAKPKPRAEVYVRGCLTCKEPMLRRAGGDITRGRFFTLKLPRDIKIKRGKVLYNLVNIGMAKYVFDLPPKMTAKTFRTEFLPHLRLDLLFRPEAGTEMVGRKYKYGVITFQPVGHRVYHKCTGAVLGAVPPAAGKFPVDKNDLTCPENQPKKVVAAPKLPTTMDQGLVKALMDMVNADLGACYEMFGKAGDVPVDVVVAPSGKVKIAKVAGDLSGTPTAECVERMVKNLTFPKFVGRDARLQWPFTLK